MKKKSLKEPINFNSSTRQEKVKEMPYIAAEKWQHPQFTINNYVSENIANWFL